MKTLTCLFLSLFLVVATAPTAMAHPNMQQQQHSHACPMHPEVTGQAGDTCPQCGMDLEASKNCPHAKHHANSKHHKCDNCPNKAGQHNKCDNCPKCAEGKDCKKCQSGSCPNKAGKHHGDAKQHKCDSCPNKSAVHDAKHTHACPMNPKITGKAGDTCPNCGMDLEPINQPADHSGHGHH
ncbi:heavy metal-binding domain-containing protein [Shewanella maritima]|uniref:heavy metal-binding domain-containing protein n=1 Tax=Shewanella maritima TaxID=2520507 RepID=UPI00373615D7